MSRMLELIKRRALFALIKNCIRGFARIYRSLLGTINDSAQLLRLLRAISTGHACTLDYLFFLLGLTYS